ncbi:hypothetical protein DFH08DRAFT_827698 [Mycena albidolilacea]|uniref:Uncharacterized protein n=1 Tax=Mycena albidolilacea TaxID=1033008 RepID=A0AAD6YXS9_9AGAR|nr:hypothetical protein DFH08DRAFT_827698 [Mycena albidolilacea]
MAQASVPERFTHTRLFREYSWLSEAFLSGTWVEAASETKGLKSYGEFLLNLDHQVPLATSIMYSDSEWRALLGLDNICSVDRDQVGTNSRAMAKCWTTLLRFQVLDVLLAAKYGTSDMPCVVHPMPSGTKQAELLTSLSTWPARITKFQTSWGKQVDQERKESKKKGRPSSGAAMAGTSSSGPAPDCEAWGLVQQLSGMTTKSLVQKTTKNLQAMGTALTWIIEAISSRNAPDDLCPTTVCVDALYGTTPIAGAATASLTVVELLRPLSYAINSSFLSAFCDLDLQKEYGHVMHQYENPTTGLYGRPDADCALEMRESLPNPDLTRKRTRTRPLQLDIPPKVEPTDNNANVVGSSVAGAVSGSETVLREAVHSSADGRDGRPLPADGSVSTVADELQHAAVKGLPVTEDRPDDQPDLLPTDNGGPRGSDLRRSGRHERPLNTKQKKRIAARPDRSNKLSAKLKAGPLSKAAGEKGLDAVEETEETEAVGSSNKRKNRSDHLTSKSKKRKRNSTITDNSVSLEDVEAAPPQISTETVSMWGYRPDGSKRTFSFPLHKNSEHMEKPMLEQLQQAIERQQRSFGDAAFVRHTPGHLPTQRARADEPNFYVLSEAEWTAMSRHERVTLYQTGRNLFISGMTVGDLNNGVEDSISILHRLDEEIEVQVNGLRRPPVSTVDEGTTDYSKMNRLTTLRNFLVHAKLEDGLVLNALKLPSSHSPHPNPLSGSGLDLEDVAYRQTAGLESFDAKMPPDKKKFFDIMGTKWTLTLDHLDAAGGTAVVSNGPGEKYWIVERDDEDSIDDSQKYNDWDPDILDFETRRYEGLVLPARGGVMLMQNVEHIVLGLPPAATSADSGSLTGTWVTGGHYFVATRIRPALSVHLHLLMVGHVLTNVDPDAQWVILVRICAFWLDVTSVRPAQDSRIFAAYLPSLSENSSSGWMDIVCIACLIVLANALDRRGYWRVIPEVEISQRAHAHAMYRRWRRWFTVKYVGRIGDTVVDWESDVFSASGYPYRIHSSDFETQPMLLHLAQILLQYHDTEADNASNSESVTLLSVDFAVVEAEIVGALESYSPGLGEQLNTYEPPHSRFWLFAGDEFAMTSLF